MPDLKISDLPPASAATGDEQVPVVQGSSTRRASLAFLLAGQTVPGTLAIEPGTAMNHAATIHQVNAAISALAGGTAPPAANTYATVADLNTKAALVAGFIHVPPTNTPADGPAIATAIKTLEAAGGGTIVLGRGTYLMGTTTLVIPEARTFDAPGAQVNIVGAGMLATRLKWATDLGAGKFAISCGDPTATRANGLGRYHPVGFYEGLFADFTVEGPYGFPGGGTPGSATANMDGLAWGARRRMVRVRAGGFRAGISLVGDHARWEDVVCRDNYYGLYLPQRSEFLYGDITATRCYFDGNRFAGIGVHDDATIVGWQMIGMRIGGAPYGIYGEAGGVRARLMEGCVLTGGMMEYLGNAMIWEANRSIGRAVERVTFDNVHFSFHDGGKLANVARTCMFRFGRAADLKFLQLQRDGLLTPGETAWMILNQLAGLHLEGCGTLFDNCAGAGKPVIASEGLDGVVLGNATWTNNGQSGAFAEATDGVAKGDLLEQTDFFFTVSKSSATAKRPPKGVAMASAIGNRIIPFAKRGLVEVRRMGAAGNPGEYIDSAMKKNVDGRCSPATGLQDGWVIGQSRYSTTDTFVLVDLTL